jgi:hypothetical protein
MQIDLSSERWSPLLLQSDHAILLVPCRVVSGGLCKSNHYLRTYTFIGVGSDYQAWRIAFDVKPELVDPCGPEVLILLYQKPLKQTFFRKVQEGHSWLGLIAMIGLNRHVQTFDFAIKLDARRKELLMHLADGYRSDLAKFAHYFAQPRGSSDDIMR